MSLNVRSFRGKLRVASCILSIIVLLAGIGYWGPTVYNFNPSISPVKHSKLLDVSRSVRIEITKNLLNVDLLVLAVLWGLIIGKRDEVRIVMNDWPELVSFGVGNIFLLSSFVLHFSYMAAIANIHHSASPFFQSDKSVPDLADPKIQTILDGQYWSLCAGAITVVLTLVSAHWLKKENP